MPSRPARSGFTLIEALIATALGAIIVATAFSAFRAASQTVAVANRLSVENAMMRAGVANAFDEVDFWREYDDPQATTRPLQGTTATPSGTAGMPFTPLKLVWPAASGTPDSEDDTRWRQDDKAWDPSDGRTWYRGNLGERSTSKMWFGRYALFSTVHPVSLTFAGNAPIPSAQSVSYSNAPAALHHWYPFQIQTLRDALGFYGLLDYAPPNSILATFDPGGTDDVMSRNGAVLNWCVRTGSSPNGNFRLNERLKAKVPPGTYRITSKGGIAVINPKGPGVVLASDLRNAFSIGNRELELGDPNEVPTFLKKTDVPEALLGGGKPASWPNATVSVSHFFKNARPISICKVRVVSPVTGNAVALTFTGWGTTLRGARLQRGRDGGWAAWDNGGGPNTPTLDDP